MRESRWYAEIQETSREYFGRDWQPNLDRLNTEFGLRADLELELMTVAPGLPPAWFNGNIAQVPENNWILVVSHNPHINHLDEDTKAWYQAKHFDADEWWDYWSTFNRDSPHRNGNFTRPLARLAARAIGEPDAGLDYFRFAFERMVFAEACPYASNKWKLDSKSTRRLMEQDDTGIQFAKRIMKILVDRGFPRLILVQGKVVLEDFETVMGDHLKWHPTDPYPAIMSQQAEKTFRHHEGVVATRGRMVPTFGFPKLGVRGGRQAHVDIDYLGDRITESAGIGMDKFKGR